MNRVLVFLSLLFLFSGCAVHTASPKTSIHSETKQIGFKNYTLGQETIVYVGKPLVLVKEYTILESESSLQANNSFTITGGISSAAVNVAGSRKQIFPIVGSIDVKGVTCKTIEIPGSVFVFAIKPNSTFSGIVAGFTYAWSPVKNINVYKINPPDTRFYPVKTQQVLENVPFTNMELVYSGLSDNTLHLLYREYTPKNLIRPAFTQELSYPSDAKIIRFRDFKIEIKEASAEKLVYSVTED